MSVATIFDIQRNSYVDGPGIRTTVFFKGCNLRCAWCHNPESQSEAPQLMYDKSRCIGCGKCREQCPHQLNTCDKCGRCTIFCPTSAREICGRQYTVDEVLNTIRKDQTLYANSNGGVTFSGGECMLQIDFLAELLKQCKKNGIHTAVDTAGHVPFEYFEKIMPDTDLFLYDVKCLDNDRHRQYTGVGNALILENLKKLFKAGKTIWIRIPIIPTVNDHEEDICAIRDFLTVCGLPEKVELLPYHPTGAHKYASLDRESPAWSVPSVTAMERLKAVFL